MKQLLINRKAEIQLLLEMTFMSTEWYTEWKFRLKECESMIDMLDEVE